MTEPLKPYKLVTVMKNREGCPVRDKSLDTHVAERRRPVGHLLTPKLEPPDRVPRQMSQDQCLIPATRVLLKRTDGTLCPTPEILCDPTSRRGQELKVSVIHTGECTIDSVHTFLQA